jgi:gamma-glutamylaminecyclotransferase
MIEALEIREPGIARAISNSYGPAAFWKGASDMSIDGIHQIFICGSALSGQPDNGNLAGATYCGPTHTAARYRMHSVENGWHPGVYETAENGTSLVGELYQLTPAQYEHLVSTEPPHMYPADIELHDGQCVTAMLYPKELVDTNDWPDISEHGGWAAYKAAQ